MRSHVHEIYFPVNEFLFEVAIIFRWHDNKPLEFITYDIQQNSVAFKEIRARVVFIIESCDNAYWSQIEGTILVDYTKEVN